MMTKLRWLGVILIAFGILGFLTVADDLRHTGELLGMGSILAAGLLALAISLSWRR